MQASFSRLSADFQKAAINPSTICSVIKEFLINLMVVIELTFNELEMEGSPGEIVCVNGRLNS